MSPGVIPAMVVALLVGYLSYEVYRKGFVGSMFGARILRTVGEVVVEPERPGWFSRKVVCRVHCLDARGPGVPSIGIEVRESFPMGSTISPVALTAERARALVEAFSHFPEAALEEAASLISRHLDWRPPTEGPLRLTSAEGHQLATLLATATAEVQ